MVDSPLISPKQGLRDNIRPAKLLLRVYSLLENDEVHTKGDMVAQLRTLVRATDEEELLLVYNELFLGLIRESAQVPRGDLKRSTLENLLRQAVVAACTTLDSYLPSLLRVNLPTVIRARGRDFFPQDQTVRDFLSDLRFDLSTIMRLIDDPEGAPRFIADKIIGHTNYQYLSSKKGVHVVGALLTLAKPWDDIADHLQRDKKELTATLDQTVKRRNDIVHRADRPQTDPTADIQTIGFAWTRQAVDVIEHICFALDELVGKQMAALHPTAAQPEAATPVPS